MFPNPQEWDSVPFVSQKLEVGVLLREWSVEGLRMMSLAVVVVLSLS